MAGFFKKLIGKKGKDSEPQADAGSWTEHEVSVDIHDYDVDESASLNSDTSAVASQSTEDFVSKAPDMQAELAQTGDTVNIASLDEADLKYAMDQLEAPIESDPLDEITLQIQSEIAADKTAKEKKETLEKLLEVTNQLKRPNFDEDFDV